MTERIDFDEFMLKVYLWLMKPMNQNVEDYHYLELSVRGKKKFTSYIEEGFMKQRFISEYPNEDISKSFLHRCAVEYVNGMTE